MKTRTVYDFFFFLFYLSSSAGLLVVEKDSDVKRKAMSYMGLELVW